MKKRLKQSLALLLVITMLFSQVVLAEEAMSADNSTQSITETTLPDTHSTLQPEVVNAPIVNWLTNTDFSINNDPTRLIVDASPKTITLKTGNQMPFAATLTADCFEMGKAFEKLTITTIERVNDTTINLSVDGKIVDSADDGVELYDEGTVEAFESAFEQGPVQMAAVPVQKAALTIQSAQADGQSVNLEQGIKSDAKEVKLILNMTPENMPYYVINNAGKKNSLTDFQFGGAFAGATLKDVKISSITPDIITMTITTGEAMQQDDMGYVGILPQNNCFGLALEAGVKVIHPTLYLNADTNGLVDNPNTTGDPTYTIKVGLKDAKIKADATKDDVKNALSFDDAFKDSQFSVNLNNDRKGFEVKLSKPADYSADRKTSGTMTLNSGVLVYADDEPVDHALSLELEDDFVPQHYTVDANGDVKVDGESLAAKVSKDVFLRSVRRLAKAAESYFNVPMIPEGVDTIIDLIFGVSADKKHKEIMNEFKKLNDRFDELNAHIDTLFKKQSEKDAFKERKNQIASLYKKADDLNNIYYQHYNQEVIADLDWVRQQNGEALPDDAFTTSVNAGKWRSVQSSLRDVYYNDLSGDNNGYYDHFISFSDDILGKGAIATKDDFYTLNNLQQKYGKVFSYETISEREKTNEAINLFYTQGYIVLRAALNYSIDTNQADKEACDAYIEEFKTVMAETSGVEQQRLKESVATLSERSDQLRKKIDQTKRLLQRLEDNNDAIEAAYQKEKKDIDAIKKAHDTDHQVYSYALGSQISTRIYYADATAFHNSMNNMYNAWNVMKEVPSPLSEDKVRTLLADIKDKNRSVGEVFDKVGMTFETSIENPVKVINGYYRQDYIQPGINLTSMKELDDPTKVFGIYKDSRLQHKQAGVFTGGYNHKEVDYTVINVNDKAYNTAKKVIAKGENYSAFTGYVHPLPTYHQNVIVLTQ